MRTNHLNRLLDMHKRKLASLEKIVGASHERVQIQQQMIQKLELEIGKLSPGPKTQQLQEEENKHFHGEEEIKELSKKAEQVSEREHSHAETIKDAEEVAVEKQPQEEEQKKNNLPAFDLVGVPQQLAPLQELIMSLQQKITEINQRQQKTTIADGAGPEIQQEQQLAEDEK